MTATEQGLYKAGDSLLHRLDPRVKVVSCLLLVVLAFAASEWAELFLLLAFVVMAFWLFPPLKSSIWQLSWMLRWLLLFTLLTYLLFSPGRTLWGISWLSLDGLQRGSFVSVQMLMAVAMSALMAVTTTTRNLSGAFGWFVQPLQWLGCRTDEWQKMLLLTLDFIPVVQSEIRVSAESDAAANAEPARTTAGHRWSMWTQKLQGLLVRLVDRGDAVALRIASDGEMSLHADTLSPLLPMALLDQLFSLAMILVVACYWLAG